MSRFRRCALAMDSCSAGTSARGCIPLYYVWLCVFVPALATARPPAAFAERPVFFEPVFPSPEAFQRSGGRRLRAAGRKPARRRFDFEERGRRFAYEYAGDAGAVQILDVDQVSAVDGVACGGVSQSRLGVRWRSGAVPGVDTGAPLRLQIGDVIAGGPEWQCGGATNSFILRVEEVETQATAESPVTWLATRATSPFEIFRNLYIDFSWGRAPRLGEGSARRLSDEPWEHDQPLGNVSYNYDMTTAQATDAVPMGPLVCRSCYGIMDAMVRLVVESNGAMPTKASLRVSGGFYAEIELAAGSDLTVLPATWTKVLEAVGPDLLDSAVMAIPLFTLVNSMSLNLRVLPTFSMYIRGDVTLNDLMGEEIFKVSADTSHSSTYFQIDWTPDGYTTSADFQLSHTVNTPELYRAGRLLMASLRFCVGLNLTVGMSDEPLTGIEVCPEFHTLCSQCAPGRRLGALDFATRLQNAEALLAPTSGEVDSELCVELRTFETNSYGDVLDIDGVVEPFSKACYYGSCVQTSHNNRFGGRTNVDNCKCDMNWGGCGKATKWCYTNSTCPSAQASNVRPGSHWAWCNPNKVSWFDGPQCIQIPLQSLDMNDIYFHMMEYDPIFEDAYTDPYSVSLNSSCRTETGCNFTWSNLLLRPGYRSLGSTAILQATVSVRSLQARRAQAVEAVCSADSKSTDVQLQVGVTTSFAGFQYPSFFHKGAMQTVVDPVNGPAVKPKPVVKIKVAAPTSAPTEAPIVVSTAAPYYSMSGSACAMVVLSTLTSWALRRLVP